MTFIINSSNPIAIVIDVIESMEVTESDGMVQVCVRIDEGFIERLSEVAIGLTAVELQDEATQCEYQTHIMLVYWSSPQQIWLHAQIIIESCMTFFFSHWLQCWWSDPYILHWKYYWDRKMWHSKHNGWQCGREQWDIHCVLHDNWSRGWVCSWSVTTNSCDYHWQWWWDNCHSVIETLSIMDDWLVLSSCSCDGWTTTSCVQHQWERWICKCMCSFESIHWEGCEFDDHHGFWNSHWYCCWLILW